MTTFQFLLSTQMNFGFDTCGRGHNGSYPSITGFNSGGHGPYGGGGRSQREVTRHSFSMSTLQQALAMLLSIAIGGLIQLYKLISLYSIFAKFILFLPFLLISKFCYEKRLC